MLKGYVCIFTFAIVFISFFFLCVYMCGKDLERERIRRCMIKDFQTEMICLMAKRKLELELYYPGYTTPKLFFPSLSKF